MKNILITAVLVALTGSSSMAQEKSKNELRGDKHAFSYAFDKSIVAYNRAHQLTPEGQRHLAEAYHNLNQDVESEAAWAVLINGNTGVIPDDYYNYAMVLKSNGKYDMAATAMEQFRVLRPDDIRAANYQTSSTGLTALLLDDGSYRINTLGVNTSGDDFGPVYYNDQIVFLSTRSKPTWVQKKYNWNRQPFLDMYTADIENGQLKNTGNLSKKLNGKLHNGNASFAKKGTLVAFSTNDNSDRSEDKIAELRIYFSTLTDGKWSDAEAFSQNSESYSTGLPCLSADGNTMYFVSNMPGGFGGADIYSTTRSENGTWSPARNLGGTVNTAGDELFPFYQEYSQVLFFTSDGLFGLGGLDVFYCAATATTIGTVYNAGTPVNTAADDFGVIMDDSLRTGYFSSDRAGGTGGDDLYAFDLLKPLRIDKKIRGYAKDNNGSIVPETYITLYDEQQLEIRSFTTTANGMYEFIVAPGKTYTIKGKKDNYIDGQTITSTSGNAPVINADVLMAKKEPVAVVKPEIVVGNDLAVIVNLNPAYFNYQEFDIRPDAAKELDKIVAIMNAHPAMEVKLSAFADCRASQAYNQTLSDKRAKATADYIKKRITRPERISGKGYGETRPVNSCDCEGSTISTCSETAHQLNRRSEFIIVKQ